MTGHTAGPWGLTLPDFDYSFEQYHDPECERDPDAGMAKVSSKGWSNFATVAVCVNGEPDAEGRANAHLIAAAPDLLAACERALDALSCAVEVGGCDPATHLVCCELRQAIAKARGTPLPPAGPSP